MYLFGRLPMQENNLVGKHLTFLGMVTDKRMINEFIQQQQSFLVIFQKKETQAQKTTFNINRN